MAKMTPSYIQGMRMRTKKPKCDDQNECISAGELGILIQAYAIFFKDTLFAMGWWGGGGVCVWLSSVS